MARKTHQRLSARNLLGLFLILITVAAGAGCDQAGAPPAPLALEQIPGEIQKAFANASSTDKGLVSELETELQATNYPTAFQKLQSLRALQGLSKDQQSVLARTMLTLTSLLQTAQTQGDQKADTALKNYYLNK